MTNSLPYSRGFSRSLLASFAIAASLLVFSACGDNLVDPGFDDDDFEPVIGLEELQDLDGMWRGLESPDEGNHPNTRRHLMLAVEDSLFHEFYENSPGCYAHAHAKILSAQEDQFTIRLEDGEERNIGFERGVDAHRAKYINHLGHEFFFERSTAQFDDMTPLCESTEAAISPESTFRYITGEDS